MVQSQEHTDGLISVDEAFSYNILTQSIENLVVLLKIMHPKLHDGELPTLEDLLAFDEIWMQESRKTCATLGINTIEDILENN